NSARTATAAAARGTIGEQVPRREVFHGNANLGGGGWGPRDLGDRSARAIWRSHKGVVVSTGSPYGTEKRDRQLDSAVRRATAGRGSEAFPACAVLPFARDQPCEVPDG